MRTMAWCNEEVDAMQTSILHMELQLGDASPERHRFRCPAQSTTQYQRDLFTMLVLTSVESNVDSVWLSDVAAFCRGISLDDVAFRMKLHGVMFCPLPRRRVDAWLLPPLWQWRKPHPEQTHRCSPATLAKLANLAVGKKKKQEFSWGARHIQMFSGFSPQITINYTM